MASLFPYHAHIILYVYINLYSIHRKKNKSVQKRKKKYFSSHHSLAENIWCKEKWDEKKANQKKKKKNENQTKRIILNTRHTTKQHTDPLTLCMSVTSLGDIEKKSECFFFKEKKRKAHAKNHSQYYFTFISSKETAEGSYPASKERDALKTLH